MAKVKCLYCGEQFEKEKEPFQKIGNRYAHQKCYETCYTNDEDFKLKIFEIVKRIFGRDYNYGAIERQRQRFIKEGMTNEEIYLSLVYYFDITKGSIEKADGRIGIVPYVKEEALHYYKDQKEKEKMLTAALSQKKKKYKIDYTSIGKRQSKTKKISMEGLI